MKAAGAVLAGGLSRRFGSPKALAPWAGGTLIEAAAGALSSLFDETLVVVKDPEAFGFLCRPGLRLVPDLLREQHPLGGLWSALGAAASRRVFVCACDMPFLQPALIEALVAAGRDCDAAIPLWRGRAQPLCGVYAQACRAPAERLIRSGRLSLQGLLSEVRTRFFSEEEVRRLDPAGLSFWDLDTRARYRAARRRARC